METAAESGAVEPIAVIGLACRLPGAADPEAFWALLRAGRDAVTEPPAGRPSLAGTAWRGGFVDGADEFDAAFFGLAPREAAGMDPRQRMALELAWAALEDAGLAVAPGEREPAGRRIGVFLGAATDEYATLAHDLGDSAITPTSATGLSRALIANRVSYALGLQGPSLVVDTGQSASLVAVHLACASLRTGEADAALAGGVSLNLLAEGFRVAERFGALSPHGRCATFDAAADGYVPGEGGALVVLKPLGAARADGDRIVCVLAGSAVNNDGGGNSLTAPDPLAQAAVIRQAYSRAGREPADVQYVELHGTATVAGDPVEAAALGAALGPAAARAGRPVLVGSVKTNIGHLGAAAGIAGLVKVALAIRHAELPPSLHFHAPNPAIPLDALGLRVCTAATAWPGTDGPALAGVSSFGMGGTNCHVVVAAPPAEPAAASPDVAVRVANVVACPVSGRGATALRANARALSARVGAAQLSTVDVGYTLATTRAAFDHRAVVLAADRAGLLRGLDDLAAGRPVPDVVAGTAAEPGGLAVLFTGQGSQRPGAGRDLAAAFAVFADALDEACAALDEYLDRPLRPLLDAAPGTAEAALLDETGYTQPALFTLGTALYRLVTSWGLRPDAVGGHSVGEITAAHAAGVLSLPDAARLVAARGRLMQALPAGGAMVAVEAAEEELLPLLGGYADRIGLAAVNGPRAVVLSGAAEAVDAVAATLRARGHRIRRLRVSHAFHSPLMAPMLAEFAREAAGLSYHPPAVPLVSNVRGETAAVDSPRHWVEHVSAPVRFLDGVRALDRTGVRRYVELGPDSVLAPLVRAALPDRSPVAVALLRADRAEVRSALAAAARLYVEGTPVDWAATYAGRPARRVDLPPYAFQRRRFWLDGTAAGHPTGSIVDRPDDPVTSPAPGGVDAARPPTGGSLLDLVRERAAAVLGYAGAHEVAPASTFRDLGASSLALVELADAVGAAAGVPVAPAVLFDHPTPQALARYLRTAADPTDAPGVAVAAYAGEPLAIVGMACRLPGGVDSPAALWDLLGAGRPVVSGFPPDRGWPAGSPSTVDLGGFLDDVAGFDAGLFGISPREALAMDPQQRLLLEVAWVALEDAGLDPLSLRGSPTGVFMGVTPQEYGPRLAHAPASVEGYLLTGTANAMTSGRVAYTYGLEGPAVTVDTACSSSLVALHLAGRALRAGECALALVGGAAVMSTPGMFVEFSRQGGLAPDGRIKAYADAADGTAWSEGVGVLVLERLCDARANGHRVLALVRGSAVNSDGASNGLTAPNGAAQQRVVRQALADAGLSPDDVDVVEGHGTGTVLGDPIEAGALLSVFGRRSGAPVWLGSVKSVVGHTQAAAGVVGVVKLVQSLRHGVVPGSPLPGGVSGLVDWSTGGVVPLSESVAWVRSGRVRRAGVSSFGISGTNAHVVIEESPDPSTDLTPSAPNLSTVEPVGMVPLLVSAGEPAALRALAGRLAGFVADRPAVALDRLGSALMGRAGLPYRAVVLAGSRSEAVDQFSSLALATEAGGPGVVSGMAVPDARVALVFGGQGAQWPGMAGGLAEAFPFFAAALDEVCTQLDRWLDRPFGVSLREVLAAEDSGGETASRLGRTVFTQAGVFAVEVALARLVIDGFGVRPEVLVGHSVGEIAAAHVAGVLTLADAARLVAARGRLMQALPTGGAMVAIQASLDEVRAGIHEAGLGDRGGADADGAADLVEIAAVNAPAAVVIAGSDAAVSAVAQRLIARGHRATRLAVSHAFHSRLMEPILDEFRAVVSGLALHPPRIALASTLTATLSGDGVDPGLLTDPEYWVRQVRQPVRFADAVTAADVAVRPTAYLELSPDAVLTASIREILPDRADKPYVLCAAQRRRQAQPDTLLAALAQLHVHGTPVRWRLALPAPDQPLDDLPTYPFQHTRYWLPAEPGGAHAVDEEFWSAVEQGDAAGLADALRVDGGGAEAIARLLPALGDWHRRRRTRSAADRLRYRVVWRPLAGATPAPGPAVDAALAGRWLVVTPPSGVDDLAAAVERMLAEGGGEPVRVDVDVITVDRAALAKRLTAAAGGPGGDPAHGPALGVVSLLGLDATPYPGQPNIGTGLAGSLLLVQALADRAAPARLWLLSQGAVNAGGLDQPPDPAQAQLWALGRTVALEHPPLWGGLVDLPSTVDDKALAQLAGVLADAGEDQVAVRADGVRARRLVRAPAAPQRQPRPWSTGGTALVTGGTGALGPLLARWLAGAGAERIVLTGRRGPDAPGAARLATDLADLDVPVTIVACDAADRAATAGLLARLAADGPPVRTVVHAAAAIRLAPLDRLTVAEFADVVAAKTTGAAILDELLADAPLDAFVLFSSIAGVWGGAGHGAYGAGNAHLDALAEQRRARGRPATAMAWGAWGGADLPADEDPELLRRQGLALLDPDTAFAALRDELAGGGTGLVVADVDWARFAPVFAAARARPLLAEVAPVEAPPAAEAAPPAGPSLAQRLAGLAEADQLAELQALVTAQAAAELGHARADAVPTDRAFKELGFDSLAALGLRGRLATLTGLAVPASLVFDHPNARAVAEYLRGRLLGGAGGERAPARVELDRLAAAVTAIPAADPERRELAGRLRRLAAQLDDGPTGGAAPGAAGIDADIDLDTITDEEMFDLIDREVG